MQIKDLQAKANFDALEVDVTSVDEPREFEKFGKSGKVANGMIKDETGEVKLTLWNEQVDQVKAGQKIKILDGWVNEWQGELQVSTGRNGKIEVVGE